MSVQTFNQVAGSPAPANNPLGTPLSASDASARANIDAVLQPLGLQALGDQAWQMHLHGYSDQEIQSWIYTTPTFQARYPAWDELNRQGRGITVTDYINYENSIRSLMQQNGIPAGMYDTPDQIAKMLTNNVSISEANDRLTTAIAATTTAPQSVRTAMQNLYGVDQGGLVSLYLDSTKALPLLQRQYAASQVAGGALDQGVTIDRATAERLAAQGVNYNQAQQGFGEVAQTTGLSVGQGERADQALRTAAAFGDAAAQLQQTRVIKGRLSQFRGGGGAAAANTGVSGLGQTSA